MNEDYHKTLNKDFYQQYNNFKNDLHHNNFIKTLPLKYDFSFLFQKKIEKLLIKKTLATRVIFHFSYNSRCKRKHCGEETKKINFLKNGSFSYDTVEDFLCTSKYSGSR